MTVSVWRIAKHTPEYDADDLSGAGAKACGGRWNSKGAAIIYTSPTISLAVLETMVHIGEQIAARNRFLIEIVIPTTVWRRRQHLPQSELPITWLAEPPGYSSINAGNAWLEKGESALLVVPSVIIPEESNILINPLHRDARLIKAKVSRLFVYDPRFS